MAGFFIVISYLWHGICFTLIPQLTRGVSAMNIATIGQGWKLGLEAGDKRKDEAQGGGTFADIFASLNDKRPSGIAAAKEAQKNAR
jgi:hypothetical protein